MQRDLLPLIEGTSVTTKHGAVRTEHILFIASGAFHNSKPSDMLPELQGRLPIRVELHPLTRDDLARILVEPEASLVKQYVALLATEGVTLEFTDAAITEIAYLAAEINERVENIGARRLHTVMERLVEEISFTASDRAGEVVVVDPDYVRAKVSHLVEGADLAGRPSRRPDATAARNCSVVSQGWSGPISRARSLVICPLSVSTQTRSRSPRTARPPACRRSGRDR